MGTCHQRTALVVRVTETCLFSAGAQVLALVRELDPALWQLNILRAMLKTEDPMCHCEAPEQPNKYIFKSFIRNELRMGKQQEAGGSLGLVGPSLAGLCQKALHRPWSLARSWLVSRASEVVISVTSSSADDRRLN